MSASGTGSSTGREEIYAMVRSAVENRRPISAVYHNLPRLFCPHRLGRNKEGHLRVLCYQFGGVSESGLKPPGSPENWRCIALDKLMRVELLDGVWQTAPNHSRPTHCITDTDVEAEDYHPERDPQQGH